MGNSDAKVLINGEIMYMVGNAFVLLSLLGSYCKVEANSCNSNVAHSSSYNGVCYWLIETKQNQQTSHDLCHANGGYLALVPDSGAVLHIEDLIDGSSFFGEFYIGYYLDYSSSDPMLRTLTGAIQTFAPFHDGGDSHDDTEECVVFYNVKFYPIRCTKSKRVICADTFNMDPSWPGFPTTTTGAPSILPQTTTAGAPSTLPQTTTTGAPSTLPQATTEDTVTTSAPDEVSTTSSSSITSNDLESTESQYTFESSETSINLIEDTETTPEISSMISIEFNSLSNSLSSTVTAPSVSNLYEETTTESEETASSFDVQSTSESLTSESYTDVLDLSTDLSIPSDSTNTDPSISIHTTETESETVSTYSYNVTSMVCMCQCAILQLFPSSYPNMSTVQERRSEVVSKLKVNKETLSSAKRKKISAADDRPSSTGIGVIGILILLSVFGTIIIADLINVIIYFQGYLNDMKTLEDSMNNFTDNPICNDYLESEV